MEGVLAYGASQEWNVTAIVIDEDDFENNVPTIESEKSKNVFIICSSEDILKKTVNRVSLLLNSKVVDTSSLLHRNVTRINMNRKPMCLK